MKLWSLRFKIITGTLAVFCLLGGGIWAISEHNPLNVTTLAPEKAKSPITAGKGTPASPITPERTPAPAAKALSHRVVEYHMDVRFDPDTSTLQGSETVTWTHPGSKPVNDLYFHLYPNAFSSMDTSFMKESGGKLRGDSMPSNGFGSMTLTDLRTTEGVSLLQRIQYVQPDDGNVKDKTLVKVHLPQPVRGGENITLKLQFEVKMPKIFARMGTSGNFVMAGQWFPKLSVYEPADARGIKEEGWNLHQYHGSSEFFSDFGIYNVSISVPPNYTVAATGFPTKNPKVTEKYKTYQYYADDVHDFAWAASPDFVVAQQAFSSPEVPGVRIKLYLDPMHKDLQERYFQAAKAALTYFSKWYGPYPYSSLSIVVPPEQGNGAGGMEYPTLITAFGASSTSPDTSLERTVIHEIGHQYFYGMVANNEFEEAWLDESFTSYAEDKLMEQEYGIAANLPLQASLVEKPEPLNQETWRYDGTSAYTQNVYIRGKLVLKDMELRIGTKAMDAVLSTYAKKYRFSHPSTYDFQKTVEKVTGESWKNYFEQYIYSGGTPDFSLDDISVTRKEDPKKDGSILYENLVKIGNKGTFYPNVNVKFTFKDGHTMQRVWDGLGEEASFQLLYSAPILSAEVDPQHSILLENKHLNNFRMAELKQHTVSRWTLSVTKLIETVLGTLSW
ncbi:MAG: M1 family metallopeptidase [Paenibacillus sp.]|nr:M1 family metallopeptidase [Paenibacillus sp.]